MITSKSNSQIREIRLLKQAKHRKRRGEYFIEGPRLMEEALEQTDLVRKIVYSPRLEKEERGAALLSLARRKLTQAEWLYVSDEVMASLADTQTHQGTLAVLKKREYGWEDLERRKGILLILHQLQDPGNLGTIFRAAEAGGSAGIVLSEGSIDPYSPKVVRASMGSIFRLPFLSGQDLDGIFNFLRPRGYRIWATQGWGETVFWEADFQSPTAVIFGQEGGGLPEDLRKKSDGVLSIPMNPPTESLNVAMAAGLIVYEAMRQKRSY